MKNTDKKNSGTAPAYQMYPRDWNENTRLKACSYAAQGLWIRLCNTSYFMEKPGVFLIENHQLSEEKILDLLPGKSSEKKKLFGELKQWGVIKRFEDGTFYCKRIYKDMKLRAIRQEAGKQGGNPNLVGNLLNQNSNQNPTPSSSSSISFNNNNNNETPKKVIEHWNSTFPKQAENVGDINLGYAITGRLNSPARHTSLPDLIAAINNYAAACKLPDSQAWKNHRLHNFFTKAIEKYWPETFNIENFKKGNFKGKNASNSRQPVGTGQSANNQKAASGKSGISGGGFKNVFR